MPNRPKAPTYVNAKRAERLVAPGRRARLPDLGTGRPNRQRPGPSPTLRLGTATRGEGPFARAENRCAVRALGAWLQAAGIHRSPVFQQMRRGDTVTDQRLSDQAVALIVKRRAQGAGAADPGAARARAAPRRAPHQGQIRTAAGRE